MASEAEVDLIISTADALPQLERDLTAIVRQAEADADSVELEALLNADDSLAQLINDLDAVIRDAELSADPIQIEASLDQADSLNILQDDLRAVIQEAEFAAREIELHAALDADVAALDAEIATLVAEVEAAAPEVDIHVDVDRDGRAAAGAGRLGKLLSGLAGPAGVASKGIGGIAAAGAALPSTVALLGSVVTAVEQLAPAAALAVSGITAVALATNTVKLAMVGVGDAVKGAFDPSVKPEDLAKAMEKLAPSARAFVTELQSMRSQLKDVQQTVQQNFFQGLDKAAQQLGQRTLPILKASLAQTATTLNQMAHGAASAALEISNDGTLGKALSGANAGLKNLTTLPGQFVTGLAQIGAAAAPAFDRVTKAVAGSASSISDKLATAFQSGALEKAINGAIDTIKQLGRIGGNIFNGLGNILGTLSTSGEGLFSTLEKVTKAFSDVTATAGFQSAISALSQTLNVVVTTVLPILSQALQALGPVFVALSGPVQTLVQALGVALQPVIAALGPVLVSLAGAFGKLVGFITPLLNLASKLIAAILPALTPLFDALGQAIANMTPFITQLASNLGAQIVPLFTTLATTVLPQLLPPLVQLTTAIFPVLTNILVALAPSLVKLSEAFANVLVALTPVLVELTNLTIKLGQELAPILEPLINLILRFVTGALGVLVAQLNGVVVPALRILVDLLKGDFSSAFEGAKTLVENIWNKITELTQTFVLAISNKLLSLVGLTTERVAQIRDRAVQGFQDLVNKASDEVSKLPDRITSALGDLGSLLYNAGADVVRGFINGLTSKLSALRSVASDIGETVSNAVGAILDMHSPSRVMREQGRNTVEGYKLGLKDGLTDLATQAKGLALAPLHTVSQGVQMPSQASAVPSVQVFLGNQLIDQHIDTRITRSNRARDRLVIQGGRA